MIRRQFLRRASVLGGSIAIVILGGDCQLVSSQSTSQRAVRIGYLTAGRITDPLEAAELQRFRSSMASYGWVEGQNLTTEVRQAEGNLDRAPMLAAELAALPLDAIAIAGASATVDMGQATARIPIVSFGGGDPVEPRSGYQ
jgi:hypothetical protein